MIATGNGIFDEVTPERLPMIQYSIEASCFSGSAISFKSMRTVCARAWTAIPARTMEEWSRTGERAVSPRERQTARRAPKNAKSVVDGAAAETNGTGSGGDTDDVGGCQRIPEDRLVDESCDPKPKSADESHDSARQAENREGTERHRIPGSQAR